MTTFAEVLAFVGNEATDSQVRAIWDAGNARMKHVRSLAAAENLGNLQPGQTVRLQGLKPKYLNGLTGTVQAIEGSRIRVKLDDVSALAAGRYVQFDHTLLAPASAVSLVQTA